MKILYVFSNLTYPPMEGLHKQTIQTIRFLQKLDLEVSLMGFYKASTDLDWKMLESDLNVKFIAEPTPYSGSILVNSLKALLFKSVPFKNRFESKIISSPEFDLVIAEGLLAAIKLPLRIKRKTLVNLVDCQSLRYQRYFVLLPRKLVSLASFLVYQLLERFLTFVTNHLVLVSSVDSDYIKRLVNSINVHTIPIAVMGKLKPILSEANPQEKLKILIWLDLRVDYLRLSLDNLVHTISANSEHVSNCEFTILSRKNANLNIVFNRFPVNYRVIEWVPDLEEFLQSHEIAILPDNMGTGLKNRLLDCVRNGVTVLASHYAIEGFKFKSEKDILCFSTSDEFWTGLNRLMKSAQLRMQLAVSAQQTCLDEYSDEVIICKWENLICDIININQIRNTNA